MRREPPFGRPWVNESKSDPNRKFDLTSSGANNGHLPVAYSITSSARAKIDCGIVKPSDSAGLKVVGDFGGEGANASGLVDDYRAGTEWFSFAQIPSGYMPLPSRPLHGHEQCIQPTDAGDGDKEPRQPAPPAMLPLAPRPTLN
jgi:hypothetical protein